MFGFRRFRIVAFIIALVAGLGAVSAAGLAVASELASRGAGEDRAPLSPAAKHAAELSADQYVFELLSMHSLLQGPLGRLHGELEPLADDGKPMTLDISYLMTYPDGRIVEVKISSFAELDGLVGDVKKRYAAFRHVLERRDPVTVREGTYDVAASERCADVFAPGEIVNIITEGRFFFVETGDAVYTGLAVKGAAAVVCPFGSILPLSGRLDGGVIRLSDASGCRLSLNPG